MGLVRAVIICAVLGLTAGRAHRSGVLPSLIPLYTIPGQTEVFKTLFNPAPYTNLTWSYYNTTVVSVSAGVSSVHPQYADRVTLLEDGSLELRNLTLEDSGDYTLYFKTTNGSEFSTNYTLFVQEPISNVSVSATATDVIEGAVPVTLICSASGSSPVFTWFNHSYSLPLITPVITLAPVTRYNGPFRCRASNLVSSLYSKVVNLTINYGPDVFLKAVISPLNYSYEGSNVILSCIVDSRPKAYITWSFNTDQLNFTGTELVLTNLTQKHEGTYQCKAFNPKTKLHRISEPVIISVRQLEEDGLSGGAIAGISIACVTVALGCAGGLAYVYRRKKAARSN